LRLGLLVAGIVLPLTVFATILVYYNYETSRRTAYDQVLQIARGVATNVDQEFRTAIASLQVLALSETLERGDLDGFRKQAEHFLEVHFPRSNVVVTDAGGQQLLNTAVPPGAPLPTYVRMDAFAAGLRAPHGGDLRLAFSGRSCVEISWSSMYRSCGMARWSTTSPRRCR
jgi:hypothetical protein